MKELSYFFKHWFYMWNSTNKLHFCVMELITRATPGKSLVFYKMAASLHYLSNRILLNILLWNFVLGLDFQKKRRRVRTEGFDLPVTYTISGVRDKVRKFFYWFFNFLKSETKTNQGSFLCNQSRGLERNFEFTAEINWPISEFPPKLTKLVNKL